VDGLAIREEMVEMFAVEIVTKKSVGESLLVIVKWYARDSCHHTGKYCLLYMPGLLY